MICNYCQQEFVPHHYNQRLCSAECKSAAISRAKKKYKKTAKGAETNRRWVTSERCKENERGYRRQPRRRKLAVAATSRYLKRHPEAQERKRALDRRYGRSPRGRDANRLASARYRKTEHGRVIRRIAKARRRGASGSFSPTEWAARLAEYDCKCAHCGATDRLEIDHITPITLGGANTIENIQPLCRSCNASKGARYVG